MIHIAKHKLYATGVYVIVNLIIYVRNGFEHFTNSALLLGGLLILIYLSKLIAWLASWGMPEALASDHGTPLSPGLVSMFLWILFSAACIAFLFNVDIY